ncbi:DNA-directed DNA polymerase alpha catalytic subunit pol1 [Gonapodya sp. JEL0774]|nr:DNA-directed DNA polymerase alpha catalytic subunit pol1 [Gonapodya sp. JEL0774]
MSRRRDDDEDSGISAIRRLREAKKKGISRLSELKFDDDESIFEKVTEEDYDNIVRNRLKEDDFVVDDDGRGYADNGEEVWDRPHKYEETETSSDEDDGKAGETRGADLSEPVAEGPNLETLARVRKERNPVSFRETTAPLAMEHKAAQLFKSAEVLSGIRSPGKRKRKKDSNRPVKHEARITTMFSKMAASGKAGGAGKQGQTVKVTAAPIKTAPTAQVDDDILASVLGNLDAVAADPLPPAAKRAKFPNPGISSSSTSLSRQGQSLGFGRTTKPNMDDVRELERIAVFGKASDARNAATEIAVKEFQMEEDELAHAAQLPPTTGDLNLAFSWDDDSVVHPMDTTEPGSSSPTRPVSGPAPPPTAPALKVRAVQTRPTTSKSSASSASLLPTFAPLPSATASAPAARATVVSAPENSNAAGWQTVVASMEGATTSSDADAGLGSGNVSSTSPVSSANVLESDGSLRLYWMDAHERSGVVYVFGKVKDKASGKFRVTTLNQFAYASDTGTPTDIPVEFLDVYNEFNALRHKYKISEWKAKPAIRKYAFEIDGVPTEETEYLKVKYSFQQPELKDVSPGKTFSHVFGTNTTAMELFLLKRKLMGPCWIDIKDPKFGNKMISWCKIEVVVADPKSLTPVPDNEQPCAPPFTVMVLNTKTVMNSQKHMNEIVAVSALVYGGMSIEDASSKAEQSHVRFTVIRQYNEFPLPAGFQELVAQTKEKVEVCRNERALINYLIAQIGRHDPDVLVGHNFVGFDLDVLLQRMKTHKVDNWSKIGRLRRTVWPKLQSGAGGTGDSTYAERQVASGRLIVDTYLAAKLNVAREELDFERIPAYFSGTARDLMLFVRLNQTDAYLVAKLMFKIQILPLSKQLTNLAGNLWSRTLLGGRAERNEFLLLHEFHKLKYILPDKSLGAFKKVKQASAAVPEMDGDDDADDEKPQEERRRGTTGRRKPAYAGGLVLEPKKGFYDMFVLLLDFNSLYPSIIQEYNIDFTTIQRTSTPEADEVLPELPDPQAPTGVLPKILKTLVDRRRQVKSLMKNAQGSDYSSLDIRQKALKLTANSMYGCLGFSHSRFYAKPLAMLITAKGREILQNTVDLATQQKLEVIYGDTDSIFLNTNTDDIKEVRRMGAEFKKVVNQRYRLLEIEMDGMLRRMLLLKKKKYAALVVEEKDGKLETTMETKGLDMVRRDWCGLSQDVSGCVFSICDRPDSASEDRSNSFRYVLEKILSSDEGGREEIVEKIHKYLETVGKETRAGLIPIEKFIINKQLTKNVEDYNDAKSQPHVQVALRLKAANKSVRVGDTIPYVVCARKEANGEAYGSKKDDSFAARAYHPDDLRKDSTDLSVDVEWYLSNQVHPPIARLIAPIEGTDTGRIADCLGLDPTKFRAVAAGGQAEAESEVHTLDSLISDEERFKNVDKWRPRCRHCGQHNEFEIVRKKRGELPTPGLQCPNPECKQIMQMPSLLAQLLDAIRSHVSRYEIRWHVCDDLGCKKRTLAVSVYGRRCPIPGCRGQMNMEYSDAALYTQLIYYDSLFDVERLRTKMENQPDRDAIVAVGTSQAPNLAQLREVVNRYLSKNARQFVDLGSLFKMMNLGAGSFSAMPKAVAVSA